MGYFSSYGNKHITRGAIIELMKNITYKVYIWTGLNPLLKASMMHFVNAVKNSIMCHGLFVRSDCRVIIGHLILVQIRNTAPLTSYFSPNTHTVLRTLYRRHGTGSMWIISAGLSFIIRQSHFDWRFNRAQQLRVQTLSPPSYCRGCSESCCHALVHDWSSL